MFVSNMLWQALPSWARWAALAAGFRPALPAPDPAWRARIYATAPARRRRPR